MKSITTKPEKLTPKKLAEFLKLGNFPKGYEDNIEALIIKCCEDYQDKPQYKAGEIDIREKEHPDAYNGHPEHFGE